MNKPKVVVTRTQFENEMERQMNLKTLKGCKASNVKNVTKNLPQAKGY